MKKFGIDKFDTTLIQYVHPYYSYTKKINYKDALENWHTEVYTMSQYSA